MGKLFAKKNWIKRLHKKQKQEKIKKEKVGGKNRYIFKFQIKT